MRGGVGAAEMSRGGSELLVWFCGGEKGPAPINFSMAVICFPYENRFRRSSCGLIKSTNSFLSEPLSSLSNFSVRWSANVMTEDGAGC